VQECIRKKRFSSGEVCGGSWFSNPMAKVIEGARVVGSMVEGNVSIGNSEVIESTILSGSFVGDNSVLSGCLIGRNVAIGNNCNLNGVVVDHNSIIPSETSQIGGKWFLQE
jgi:ADP-glucose pyrophosphorylase